MGEETNMEILLIDDDILFLDKICKDLFAYFSEYYEEVNIISYSSDFLSIKFDSSFDYAFIDIDLPDKNGIELAQTIKLKNPKTTLSFVSAHTNLIHNSLIIQPFYFIRKAKYKKDLEIFFSLIKIDTNERKIIDFNYNGLKSRVFTDEIIYIEAQLHKLIIKTKDREYYDNHSLKEIITFLPDDIFVRVHKSYIVNLDYLISYKKNLLILIDNIEITIGRSFKKDIDQFYQMYLIR